ncbi:MAG: glycerol-3-phosphate 1-O-acyltransferase PlsY [Thermomicrobiales bacterium]
MSGPVTGVALTVAAFFAGAIPWGYLIGRFGRGIDLRTVGSGGTGATNVLRTMGRGASIAVLILDFLKGLIPVVVAQRLELDPWWVAAVAVAPVVGHCWSPFIGFKGGKGMATGAGSVLALFPYAMVALAAFVLAVWTTRYVSLGSLLATAIAALLAVIFAGSGRLEWASAAAVLAIAAIIFERHRANIARLRQGTERRFGESIAV